MTEYDVTNISGSQPRKNMITMVQVGTSDLMMIMTWAMDISFQSPQLKWDSWIHTTPYRVMTKVIERTSSMFYTPPHDKLHKHLHIFNACEHCCIMMIMVGSKMSKTGDDLKIIMYRAYDTPHKLCNIGEYWNMHLARTNCWANTRTASDLGRHEAHVTSLWWR